MKRILVTGCLGQLGSEIRELAHDLDDEFEFFYTDKDELDITDRSAVYDFIEQNNITVVVNCAAFTAVDKAEDSEELCDLLNNVAPGYLAEAVASMGGSMIQVSTDYVFDGIAHTPYDEDAQTNPQTIYGQTKLRGEENVIRTCPGSMVIRTAWLYSTHGNNFVKTMLRLGKERKELGVVADQIGSPTYARDLAKAILCILQKDIIPGVYHYTNEGVCSWYDFAQAIHRFAGIDAEDCAVRPLHTEEYPVPAPRPHFSVLDKSKIKQTYGIEIPWWSDSLKECIEKLK